MEDVAFDFGEVEVSLTKVNKSGIDSKKVFKNNVAYIQSWSKQLKQNPRLIVSAAGKAEAAVEYIMGEN